MKKHRRILIGLGVFFVIATIAAVSASIPIQYLRTQVQQTQNCDCPSEYGLVCAMDGHTYTGSCEAECHGGGIFRLGECPL